MDVASNAPYTYVHHVELDVVLVIIEEQLSTLKDSFMVRGF